jgi:uncharacterized delta-60 repeat protein
VQINDVISQPDDKIIVVGQTSGYFFDDIFLARYESDGLLDSTFGEDGIVVTPINPRDDQAFAVALQSDGKILVGGSTYEGEYQNYEMIIIRYTADGLIDSSFGDDGITTFDTFSMNSYLSDIDFDSEGRIIAVGHRIYGGGSKIVVARLTENGLLDRSVVIEVSTAEFTQGESVVIDNDGIIVVGYHRDEYVDDENIILARLNSDLELDPSFGSLGMTITDLDGTDDRGRALLMQDGARLIVAGSTEGASGSDFVLVGYTLSGLLDTSFGNNGVVVTSVGPGNDEAWDMAFLNDGRIVVVGQSHNGEYDEIAIVRYLSNGTPDQSLGANGILKTAIGSGTVGKAVAVQPDNYLIVAGYYSDGLHDNQVLIRYTQTELDFTSYIPLFKK